MTELGVASITLMENAGKAATKIVREKFADRLGHVVIVGGTGQNGGDGWVVARLLFEAGISPTVVLVGDPSKVTGDAAINLEKIRALGVEVKVLLEALRDATLFVALRLPVSHSTSRAGSTPIQGQCLGSRSRRRSR